MALLSIKKNGWKIDNWVEGRGFFFGALGPLWLYLPSLCLACAAALRFGQLWYESDWTLRFVKDADSSPPTPLFLSQLGLGENKISACLIDKNESAFTENFWYREVYWREADILRIWAVKQWINCPNISFSSSQFVWNNCPNIFFSSSQFVWINCPNIFFLVVSQFVVD